LYLRVFPLEDGQFNKNSKIEEILIPQLNSFLATKILNLSFCGRKIHFLSQKLEFSL